VRRDIFGYFLIAAKLSTKKQDKRQFFLGAVGIRSDGAIVKSQNGSSQEPFRTAHAEYRLSKKLDHGAVVYVARVKFTGFGMARPCPKCMKALLSARVSKIYYTISNTEYGIIHVSNGKLISEIVVKKLAG
jgi:tRNA(Arg) A34 adenosine deaminase TadA